MVLEEKKEENDVGGNPLSYMACNNHLKIHCNQKICEGNPNRKWMNEVIGVYYSVAGEKWRRIKIVK